MTDLIQATTILTEAIKNPTILLFLTLFAIGYILKEKTVINNQYIPVIIAGAGMILGATVIQLSITGAAAGLIAAAIIIATYDIVKPALKAATTKYIKSKFK